MSYASRLFLELVEPAPDEPRPGDSDLYDDRPDDSPAWLRDRAATASTPEAAFVAPDDQSCDYSTERTINQ